MTEPNREAPSRADRPTPPPTPPVGPIPPLASDDRAEHPAGHVPLPKSTPTRQFAALFLVPVCPDEGNVQDLKALLKVIAQQTSAAMRGSPEPCALLAFRDLASVHYARVLLIEHWVGLGPMLALATDYDGPAGEADCREARAFALHLAELLTLRDGLNRLFRHCTGYDGELKRYLLAHRVRSKTFFVGAPGRSRDQISWEAKLRRRVTQLAAEHAHETDPERLRELVRRGLKDEGWSLPTFPEQPELRPKLVRALTGRILLLCAALAVAAWLLHAGLLVSCGLALLAVALLVMRFRHLERTDPQLQPRLSQATHDRLRAASEHENDFLQNQLTHLVAIKPGPLRWWLIRAVFHVLQLFATYRYNHGKLGGIPSIHFARWVLIPKRGVLFFSNFDNSWQSYLGDFIDKASAGLTAVWSNTVGYPRSTWLLWAGAHDAARFLAWAREHQLPTQVWYCAYPELSIVNINDNTEIHRGLADPAQVDARTWQLRLSGVDRAQADELFSREQTGEPPVPLERVQGLIVRGYGHMPEARYLMFRVRSPRHEHALRWLGQLPLTDAAAGSRSREPREPLINVAFSYDGLRALGVNQKLCESFSTAFVRGAHDDYRARINGDLGDNAPANWAWGSAGNPVHVLLLVFAKSRASVERYAEHYTREALDHGFELVTALEGTTLPGRKEHFGFRDGIGQPQIRGCGGTDQEENAVAAGEFLLGRRDGYGNRADAPESPNGFSFGHNGSYLVFRQLEQDVPAFWRHFAQGADKAAAIRGAAKRVGRWPSGASLVRHPDKDPDERRFEDEDDFSYLANDEDNDRYGARCPFGAHIRRAHPRDWSLGETREEARSVSNLHRIMRRGRPYGEPLDESLKTAALIDKALAAPHTRSTGRGLQFLCFNANIERQFEFIQQHWCNNPHFAGMDHEPDALLGPQQSFVRVIGGCYFFMPSISAVKLLADGVLGCSDGANLEAPPPDEQLHIESLIDMLRKKATRDYAAGRMLRAAHPKMHGCVEARLRVEANLAPELAVGLFAKPVEYRCWIRFSNEEAPPGPDSRPGIRGVAIKLLGVPGAKLLDGEEYCTTHDVVLISTDAFVTKDAADFDALIKAFVAGTAWLFFVRRPRAAWNLFKHAGKKFGSVLDITYFSATPYLLGSRAVKYMLRPSQPGNTRIPKNLSDHYLADALAEQLACAPAAFDFLIQHQADPESMPVEDPGVVWKQSISPFRKVARVELLQQVIATDERRALGDTLSFNPWRCLPEHRPLGGINRARRQVYRAMSRFRHARNDTPAREPE